MKKIIKKDYLPYGTITIEDLTGPIDKVIKYLNRIKDENSDKYSDLTIESNGYDPDGWTDDFSISGMREETDKEFERRKRDTAKRKEREAAKAQEKEERERKLLEKLKDKYER